jgi:lipopolysaccharide/colanic/teichoic acid biosynthesis glycosyltransferase
VVAKRLFDIIASALALVVLSPLLLIIALFVKLDSPGPVVFRQPRLGRGARPFEIYKFRTMVVAAQTHGTRITVNKDARVTRIGRILRRFDLDELPTFLNVLKGDMSIVGPRPEVPEYLPFYSDEEKEVFSVRPGLTDPGTLAFRDEATRLVGEDPEGVYTREILPHKLALNLEYVKQQSLLYDLKIIMKTLAAVIVQSKG